MLQPLQFPGMKSLVKFFSSGPNYLNLSQQVIVKMSRECTENFFNIVTPRPISE